MIKDEIILFLKQDTLQIKCKSGHVRLDGSRF